MTTFHADKNVTDSTDSLVDPAHMPILSARGSKCTHAKTLRSGHVNTSPNAGTPYPTITLAKIVQKAIQPPSVKKSAAAWAIPSTHNHFDGRSHGVQKRHGTYPMIPVDVDDGSPSLETVVAAVRNTIGQDRFFLVYASVSSKPENLKWRVIIPLKIPLAGHDYRDTSLALYNRLEASGLKVDKVLSRPGQVFYLPNKGAAHWDWWTPDCLGGTKVNVHKPETWGKFLDLADKDDPFAAQIIEDREGDRQIRGFDDKLIQDAAETRAREREARLADGDQGSIIESFNLAHDICDLLPHFGFEYGGSAAEWKSPHATTGFSTADFGEYWVSMSQSDTDAGMGHPVGNHGYCAGDAFDLFCHFRHGGDVRAACADWAKRSQHGKTSAEEDFDAVPMRYAEDPWAVPEDLHNRDGKSRAERMAIVRDAIIANFETQSRLFGEENARAFLESQLKALMEPDGLEAAEATRRALDYEVGVLVREKDMPENQKERRDQFGGILDMGHLIDRGHQWKRDELLRGILPRTGFGMIFGPSGAGKSFVSLDLAMRMVTGLDWQENAFLKDGAALYLMSEGGQVSAGERVKAWHDEHQITPHGLMMLTSRVAFGCPEKGAADARALAEYAKWASDHLAGGPKRLRLVVIDTLAANFVGEENSAAEMAAFAKACRFVGRLLDCLVICVHHSGKDASLGARGSSALRADVDFELRVHRDKDTGVGTIDCTKNRNSKDGQSWYYDLQERVCGIDPYDGSDAYSLVPVPVAPPMEENPSGAEDFAEDEDAALPPLPVLVAMQKAALEVCLALQEEAVDLLGDETAGMDEVAIDVPRLCAEVIRRNRADELISGFTKSTSPGHIRQQIDRLLLKDPDLLCVTDRDDEGRPMRLRVASGGKYTMEQIREITGELPFDRDETTYLTADEADSMQVRGVFDADD